MEATHQLLGDGAFGGDRSRATIEVAAGTNLVVRGVAATSLRGSCASTAAVRARVGPHAGLIYSPGPILPHNGSCHASGLRVSAAPEARLLIVATLVPGRSAMGEVGAFEALRLKTHVCVEGEMAFAEDSTALGEHFDRARDFVGFGAFVTLLAFGNWPPAGSEWWEQFPVTPGLAGRSALRNGGLALRALFPTLGAAREFVSDVEERARRAPREGVAF